MQESILLAGSTDKGVAMLQSLLPGGGDAVSVCRSAGEARRAVLEKEFALVLINAPMQDENGLELSMELAQGTAASVILFVKADMAEIVASRVEESGVVVIAKPVARPLFDQALHVCRASHSRLLALHQEKQRLERKLDEQRMVGRAKCLLVQYMQFSEDQAHRFIEKQAMDTRQTRLAVARSIIDEYSI